MLGKENVSVKTENATKLVSTDTVELVQVCVASVNVFFFLLLIVQIIRYLLNTIFLIIFQEDNDDDDFEDVVDNDAGEDLLLQKLAEQSVAAQDITDEPETEGSSSRE